MAGVFGQVSASLETSREFGNVSNSSNLFASKGFGGNAINAFGAASSPFQISSVFGSGSNLSNPFASNAMGTTNFPNISTQGSGFGCNATNAFGAASYSFGTSSVFGSGGNSSDLLASNAMGTTNFPNISTQGSAFGGSTTNVFGEASSSLRTSSLFGNGSNLSNVFAPNTTGTTRLPTQGSIFGGSTTNVLGSTSSSLGMSSLFGKGSNSSYMFASNTTGSTTSPSFINQGSFIGGSSTGLFGVSSASSPSLTFGQRQPAAFFGSSSTLGTTSVGNYGPFGSTTSRGAFGGCRIKSYEQTIIKDDSKNCRLISISGMPCYAGKSHEELRWENYGLKSGVQQNSVSDQAQGINKQHLSIPLPSVTSSLGILTPSCSAPAFSTNMNTPTFQIPSPNISAFHTRTPIFTGSGCDQVTAGDPNNQPLQNPQLSTQALRLWPDYLLRTTPKHLSIHSPSTGNGCDQVASSSAISSIKPWPNNGNSVIDTIQASSPWTTPLVSAGNNGGFSLDVGSPQPNPPQQFTATSKVTESIIAVKDPFGSETKTFQPVIDHSVRSSFIQHGISSMPVSSKPAKIRVPSYFTSRHHSLKPLTVSVRKYHPSSDGTKVPFFDRAAEGLNISKGYNYIIPRENPRSVIAASTEPTFDSASKKEASSLNHAATVEYEDGTGNAKKAQISSSAPISCKDDFAKTNDNAKELELLLPKLQRSDYYTEPKIEKLASIESSNPGFCSHVKDFVLGRDGFGWVKFYGETNVRGLNLDSLVHFNYREVIVYDDESEKPPVGQGLNKAAEVTLLNVKCVDKIGKQHNSGKMVEKYIEKLKQAAEKQGAEFVSYDPVKGEWRFSVKHF
ncbi:nuclear pore complex protein NUP98A-like isoform X2 [Chenopodium quinoa]|uniref:nuclear pore complex protein NUP98A-like isoform X2 n=1 Tax=Chenopodium quinoa TaxID=63459 RepID=UPI000B787D8A|nr:nuclear pore complex protein NUP98A-like isoform X2 [Chenopodium quinoa]